MGSKPLISVVLGTYNRLAFLKLTIESIRKEVVNIPHEIIVIDGSSTDGTLEWLIQQKDILTLVQHNRGEWQGKPIQRKSWGYFMNLGFKCAQGKYICMLSDDCLLLPGAIINGYTLFENELNKGEKLGAAAFYWRNWPTDKKYVVLLTLGNKMFVNHGMFLKQALEDVGYVDEETYLFYHADGDLCLKMWQQGYRCIDSPDSYVEHFNHANLPVRKSNYTMQPADWRNYLLKWSTVFYDPVKKNIDGTLEKEFVDVHETANLFLNVVRPPTGEACEIQRNGCGAEKMRGYYETEGCDVSTDAGNGSKQDVLEESQKAIIHKFMQKEDVVVDTASLVGEWGKYVLQRVPDVKLHLVDAANITLDHYCREKGVYRINFLKVDARGQEFNILSGAQELLKKEYIDYVQFRYTDTSPDSGANLIRLLETMKSYHYELFLIQNNVALRIENISPVLSEFQNSHFLVANSRLKIILLGLPPVMHDLDQLYREHSITPRGVIHIGAHEGKELDDYLKMGFQRIFFIEANPEVYQRLQDHIQGSANVLAANVAVSDFNGTITLHVTNFDQSSSILPLKEHKEVYPAIQEVSQREVPCRTLDDLLKEKGIPPQEYNMLNIDIQGAELKALRGALNTLASIEAINTEVNFKELYEGCAIIHEIDEFLELQGFQRVKTTCPNHSSWGDAFYVKKQR
ncbi:MAG: FkbM family methyltransferase [Bacillota bacterium]